MPKLEITNDNMYQKKNTGADYNRPLGILKDVLVNVSAAQETSRIIPTGFKFLMGTHELEVYVNGSYKRRNEMVNSIVYGDYSEYTNFAVQFNPGVIQEDDLVRFRVTTANYKIVNDAGAGASIDPTAFANMQASVAAIYLLTTNNTSNIEQVGRDSFGISYAFTNDPGGSIRTIGTFTNADATPNVSAYRVWRTSALGATITNFTGSRTEDMRLILFSNDQTIIKHNANIVLASGKDIVGFNGRTLFLFYDGFLWREMTSSSSVKVSDTLSGADWNASGNYYYGEVDITNIHTTNVNVECYDDATNIKISPYKVELVDEDNLKIWMPVNSVDVNVVVQG